MALDLSVLQGKAKPYQGTAIGNPVALCQPIQTGMGPRSVRIDIDWTLYPSNAVLVNLSGGVVSNAIDAIRSMHIDNLGVLNAVVVAFSDTGYEIQAPPDSTITACPATNGLQFYVLLEGSIRQGKTRISVNNFMAAPDTNNSQPLNLPVGIASGTDTGVIATQAFAIGDQKALFTNTMGPFPTNVFNTVTTGIMLFTEVIGYTVGAYTTGSPALILMELINSQNGAVLFEFEFYVMPNLIGYQRTEVGRYTHMQVGLNMATTSLLLTNQGSIPSAGTFFLDLTYTLSAPSLVP